MDMIEKMIIGAGSIAILAIVVIAIVGTSDNKETCSKHNMATLPSYTSFCVDKKGVIYSSGTLKTLDPAR